MATLTFRLVLSGHPHSYKWVKEQMESNELGAMRAQKRAPGRGEAIQFLFRLENFAPLSTFCHVLWNSNNPPPPPHHVPLPESSSSLKTFLRCIPEELGNWGVGVWGG